MFIKPTLYIAFFLTVPASLRAQETIDTNSNEKISTHNLIRYFLGQDFGTRKFSFPDVILASSGKKIIPLNPENPAHKLILEAVVKGARESAEELSAPHSPVRKLRRINEASRYFENLLYLKINTHHALTCTIPKNTRGKARRSGYPDILITHTAADGTLTHAYLDPKLFEKKSRSSSLRTFYFEPRTRTNKIQHEAIHLLLGISHDGKTQAWTFTGWELCDLFHFQVRLKTEFQASNKDIYRPHIIIKSSSSK